MIVNRPIWGYGLGGFSVYYSGYDERSYPHNFIYEIFAELGVFGLILFFLLIFLVLKKLKSTNNYLSIIIIIYLLLNFAKGHSIFEVKFFYFLLFALLSFNTNKKIKHEQL